MRAVSLARQQEPKQQQLSKKICVQIQTLKNQLQNLHKRRQQLLLTYNITQQNANNKLEDGWKEIKNHNASIQKKMKYKIDKNMIHLTKQLNPKQTNKITPTITPDNNDRHQLKWSTDRAFSQIKQSQTKKHEAIYSQLQNIRHQIQAQIKQNNESKQHAYQIFHAIHNKLNDRISQIQNKRERDNVLLSQLFQRSCSQIQATLRANI